MNANERRVPLSGDIPERLGEQRVNLGAVLALERDVVSGLQLQPGHDRVVVRRQLAQRTALMAYSSPGSLEVLEVATIRPFARDGWPITRAPLTSR
jgi:hypothetical protein